MKSLRQIIQENLEKGTAVGHFNVPNLEVAQAVVDAARLNNAPVILGLSEGEREYIGLKQMVAWKNSISDVQVFLLLMLILPMPLPTVLSSWQQQWCGFFVPNLSGDRQLWLVL